MNSIPVYQNQEEQLQRLAAQRWLYSKAKTVLAWQMSLVIAVAGGLSFIATVFPGIQEYATLLCLLILLSDAIVLEPLQKRLVQQAAKIQEMFDCSVLGLKWQEVKIGCPPKNESIATYAERYKQNNPDYAGLKNWYEIIVGQIPLGVARIICQMTNIRWDSKLRRCYATGILLCLAILAIVVFAVGASIGMTMEKFVYAILTPLSPAFLWGIRECRKQLDTAKSLDRLMKQATSLWEKAYKKTLTEDQLEQESRTLQNEIYDHRRSAPLVFDRVYDWSYKWCETQTTRTLDELVRSYLESLNQGG